MACGGLLGYLYKNKVVGQLSDESEPVVLRSIQPIQIAHSMHIDRTTLQALSIFSEDLHPGASSSKKEGLSVFGILDKTKTKPGSRMLRAWMTFPAQRYSIIQRRLNHISFFTEPRNEDLLLEARSYLRNMKDINRIMSRFSNCRAKLSDWRGLSHVLQSCTSMWHIANKIAEISGGEKAAIFTEILPLCTPDIQGLAQVISNAIDFDTSTEEHVAIKPGVDGELDYLKSHYEGLGDFLTEVAEKDLKDGLLPAAISSMNIVYIPQLGYHVKVLATDLAGSPSIDGLSLQFKTDHHIFYKNSRTKDLDAVLGDIHCYITDIEASLIRELEIKVLEHDICMREMGMKIFELDVLLALSVVAKENMLVRPQILPYSQEHGTPDSSKKIVIEEGRHLLTQLYTNQFIPNSTTLDVENGDEGCIQVITGPNNSGKSVYLKQVGIIVYLAHIGSFVPAKSAIISICDRILSRMHSIESVSSTLSTFSCDTSQVAYMLRHCTSRSLLLIDEYGKGTCAFDGVALLASTITELANLQEPPKALITTHFHELFTFDLLKPSRNLKFLQMSFICHFSNCENPQATLTEKHVNDDMVFLYKLIPGTSHRSYGIYCARLANISTKTIVRAQEVCNCLMKKVEIPPRLLNSTTNDKNNNIVRTFFDIYATSLASTGLNLESFDQKRSLLQFLALVGFPETRLLQFEQP